MYSQCQKYSCIAILQIIYPALYLHELKKDRIAKGFDRLAPIYTRLSQIFFGKSLERAQAHLLDVIKTNDRVLILGGGSGDLLKQLLKNKPQISVDYIDISEKMIGLARERNQNPTTVNFIIGTEQNIPTGTYSIIITNFYLDLFSDNTLPHVIHKIKVHTNPGTQWLVTDFVSKKNWHKIMLWVMYRFFRITTGIEARSLPDWERHLTHTGLDQTGSSVFFNGFIKSCCYVIR